MDRNSKETGQNNQASRGGGTGARYIQRRNEGGGSQSKWQVDTKQLRIFMEHNLKGDRRKETLCRKYQIILDKEGEDKKHLGEFYSQNREQAKQRAKKVIEQHELFVDDVKLKQTEDYEMQKRWVKSDNPLMNEDGTYHILSIIDPIFSKVGYFSKLDENEIKDMMWDKLVTVHTTIMKNHEAYGITKSSRDEVTNMIDDMCFLVLKAAEEGWTGQRFQESVHEKIHTREPEQRQGWGIFK